MQKSSVLVVEAENIYFASNQKTKTFLTPASERQKSIEIIENYRYKYVYLADYCEPRKGSMYRIVGKVVEKEKRD